MSVSRGQQQIFRAFLEHKKPHEEHDLDLEDVERDAPKANIFRWVAAETERMKHEEVMMLQIRDLAKTHEAQILERMSKDVDAQAFRGDDACEKYLLQRLLKATVEDVSRGGQTMSFKPGSGFPAINFFLKERASRPERVFFGLLLVPSNSKKRMLWLKNRFVAFLVAAMMTMGPFLVFLFEWYSDDNPIWAGDIVEELTWKELVCFGTKEEFGVTFVGFLFLLMIFEITRSYCLDEADNSDKMCRLPNDSFWMNFGQTCNILCIVFTSLAMPLVFWTEMHPKDIIFDSLAMLFLFQLDDFSGGCLSYLDMDDSDFQARYVELVACLGQCPVRLEDIFVMSTNPREQLWRLRWGSEGLMSAKKEHVDSYVERRYIERRPGMLLSPDGGDDVVYDVAVAPNERYNLQPSRFRLLWVTVWWFLTVSEVLVPFAFATINKPCYGPGAENPAVVAAPEPEPAAAPAPASTTAAAAPVPAPPATTSQLPPAPTVPPVSLWGARSRNIRRRHHTPTEGAL